MNPVARANLDVRPSRRRVLTGNMRHETRVTLYAVLGPLPAVGLALLLLWTSSLATRANVTLTLLVLGAWLAGVTALHRRVVVPLRTLSNMLAALREGDYSLRARGARADDALGEVNLEVNELGRVLREQRLGAIEAAALLRRVMAEIDVAVFAFDGRGRLRLANAQGERFLGREASAPVGATAEELGLSACLMGETPRLMDAPFPQAGRWELRRGMFMEGGEPQQLLVISDLTRTLREEERQAWQRLLQVLRHEVNNSLAPIHSLAESLSGILQGSPRPADWETDVSEGLGVISQRAVSLNRFMSAYARLMRLPRPHPGVIRAQELVRRVASLEARVPIQIVPGPDVSIRADGDQLEQVLVNLLRNAADAALETGGTVTLGWRTAGSGPGRLELWVDDEGPGIANAENLFVPFYTTKPDGTGIGLVLSRQIAEAHGGTLSLGNREDGHGCRALLVLPLG